MKERYWKLGTTARLNRLLQLCDLSLPFRPIYVIMAITLVCYIVQKQRFFLHNLTHVISSSDLVPQWRQVKLFGIICCSTTCGLVYSLLIASFLQCRRLHSPFIWPANSNKLFIVISSDEGLCGGIHSSVSKATRCAINNQDDSPLAGASVMVIGERSKAQLSRAPPIQYVTHFQLNWSWYLHICGFDHAEWREIWLYNKFLSTISYEAGTIEVKGADALEETSAYLNLWNIDPRVEPSFFKVYENEDDATKDLAEFSLANVIYAVLVEGHACEQNALDRSALISIILYSNVSPFYAAVLPWTTLPRTPRI